MAYQPAGSGKAGWGEFGGMRGGERQAGRRAGRHASHLADPGTWGLTGMVKGSSCLL